MKKIKWFVLLGCLISLLALPGMAEEASLPAIRITYAADVELSQEEAVEAQVVLEDAGEETSLEAQLRLHDSTLDVVETALPQKACTLTARGPVSSCTTTATTQSIPRSSARCAAT